MFFSQGLPLGVPKIGVREGKPDVIYIHVVYEKNEKPCGSFMATRTPPAPGLHGKVLL